MNIPQKKTPQADKNTRPTDAEAKEYTKRTGEQHPYWKNRYAEYHRGGSDD